MDNNTYSSSRTTQDTERLEQLLLEMLRRTPEDRNTPMPSPTEVRNGYFRNRASIEDVHRTRESQERLHILRILDGILGAYNNNISLYQNNMRYYNDVIYQSLAIMNRTISQQNEYTSSPDLPMPTIPERTVPNVFQRRSDGNSPYGMNIDPRLFTDTSGRMRGRYIPQRRNTAPVYVTYPYLNNREGDNPYISDDILRDIRTAFDNFQDVIVRPTAVQIEMATEQLTYDPSMEIVDHTCPIDRDEYAPGENIRRIRHCGHAFRESAFQQWFQQSVRCPVCRYDIRDYREEPTTGQPSSMPTEPVNPNVIYRNVFEQQADSLPEFMERIVSNLNNIITPDGSGSVVVDLSIEPNMGEADDAV